MHSTIAQLIAMHSTDCLRAIDSFFDIKVQMVDPTVQNGFSYEYLDVDQILYFLLFFKIARKSLFLMAHNN
jgi:hypothetical protein